MLYLIIINSISEIGNGHVVENLFPKKIQGGRLTGKPGKPGILCDLEKPGNDREFFKIFKKKRFQFVVNALHKVIYSYIILCISKFPPCEMRPGGPYFRLGDQEKYISFNNNTL